jgi:hypothetical protein
MSRPDFHNGELPVAPSAVPFDVLATDLAERDAATLRFCRRSYPRSRRPIDVLGCT